MSEQPDPLNNSEVIPSSKTYLILGTTEGFDYHADFTLLTVEGDKYFTNRQGVKVANIDRFNFQKRAKERLDLLLEKNPDLNHVDLRYGGMTEVTVFTAVELLKRGMEITSQRYDKNKSDYIDYYTVTTKEDLSRQRESNGLDPLTTNPGTMPRHDYPEEVKTFLFPTQTTNLGTIQRDFYPGEVQGFLFEPGKDKVEPHPAGGFGVSIDFKEAPELAMGRISDFIQDHPDVSHVNLYYSGLTEVTIIAVFELAKAGKSVSLMGHSEDDNQYKEGALIEPMNYLDSKITTTQRNDTQSS